MAVRTYYVDFDNGNDGNGGTDPDTDAWKTMQHAADNAACDGADACYVWYRAGMTSSISAKIDFDANSGSATGRIYHIADRFGEKWVDTGEIKLDDGGTMDWAIDISACSYLTIRGFEIEPDKGGIYNRRASKTDTYNIIEECFIHDNSQSGAGLMGFRNHMSDGTIYRVKSNALYGLAIGISEDAEMYGWASFSGKATYMEPGWPEPEGNHEFLVYVEDRDEPGSGVDQFWIEVRDKDGDVILIMSMDRPGNENTIAIMGGNLVVPH